MVTNASTGLSITYGLVSDLNTALAPLDLAALEDLPTDFTTLLERIDNVDSGLESKASITDLNTKASQSALDSTNAIVATKANQSALVSTNAVVATKANQAALDSTNATVATKANQAALDSTNAAVASKVSQSALDNTNAAVAARALISTTDAL